MTAPIITLDRIVAVTTDVVFSLRNLPEYINLQAICDAAGVNRQTASAIRDRGTGKPKNVFPLRDALDDCGALEQAPEGWEPQTEKKKRELSGDLVESVRELSRNNPGESREK